MSCFSPLEAVQHVVLVDGEHTVLRVRRDSRAKKPALKLNVAGRAGCKFITDLSGFGESETEGVLLTEGGEYEEGAKECKD
jgi:hypothetical protein